jgi:hypothetical protein
VSEKDDGRRGDGRTEWSSGEEKGSGVGEEKEKEEEEKEEEEDSVDGDAFRRGSE